MKREDLLKSFSLARFDPSRISFASLRKCLRAAMGGGQERSWAREYLKWRRMEACRAALVLANFGKRASFMTGMVPLFESTSSW